ncbi:MULTISPECIES: lipid II flippase MurJ [Clostridium]|uniref:lipid II flippase MurJ n=1 Tax=Clostridium TaxID=1485 RepID=UPI0029121FDB|nr:lipid II flippase MurJ [Clostridium sp.]MDU4143096.1 lipid II flippase MurJ [Clostridium sp.]
METIILALFTLLSKSLGLIRDILLADNFGATYVTDVFIISITLPVVLLESISSAVLVNYIPIISKIKSEKKEKEIGDFNGILLAVIITVITAGVVLFCLWGQPFLHLFALGFEGEKFQLLFKFSKITIFAAYFIILGDIFKAHCQQMGRFYSTAISSIIVNITVIVGIYLSEFNDMFIVYAFLVGNLFTFCVLAIDARRCKIQIKLNMNFHNIHLKKILFLSAPIILNNAIWEINGIIDTSLVSTLGDGYVTSLNYANKITSIVVGIATASIATVVYPKYARVANDKVQIKNFLKKDLKKMSKLLCPICVFCVLKADAIVNLVFANNNFSDEILNVVITSFRIYSMGMFFSCIKVVLFKYYYAQQNTKIPAQNTVIAIIVNIVLNIILIRFLGYQGVVIATVISSVLTVMLLSLKIDGFEVTSYVKGAFLIALYITISILIIICLNVVLINVQGIMGTFIFGGSFVFIYLIYFAIRDRDVLQFKK